MGLMGRYYGKGLKKRKKAKLEGIVEDCKERKVLGLDGKVLRLRIERKGRMGLNGKV